MKHLKQNFPEWNRMYPEIKVGLIGAEKLYHQHINDETIPRNFLAAPFILMLEREFIQFYKHKFPKYLNFIEPNKPLEEYNSIEGELKRLIIHKERIGLGHLINWLMMMNSKLGDELLNHLRDFTKILDPNNELINKENLSIISLEILQYRKFCVHLSKIERWLDTEILKKIRKIILLDFNDLGKGLLPAIIEYESNFLNLLSLKK